MCELAKTLSFVAISKCKKFKLKISKRNETQSIKVKIRKKQHKRNCIVNHLSMKQNERQKRNLKITIKETNKKIYNKNDNQ